MTIKILLRSFNIYLITAIISVILVSARLDITSAVLTVPLVYSGDTILGQTIIKGLIENHTYWSNIFLGAPFSGAQLYDFPQGFDNLNWLVIGILTIFSGNAAVIINLFFLITFPLVALTALWTLKKFGFKDITAIILSLLYSFVPYHFTRSTDHLFLSAYFLVPIMIWVSVKICEGAWSFGLMNKKSYLTLIILCLLFGSGGLYYAAFGAFFFCLAGLINLIATKRIDALLTAGISTLLIIFSLNINILPAHFFQLSNGANLVPTSRSIADTENYSLKISRLLLPASQHPSTIMQKIRAAYPELLRGEGHHESLGVVTSVGFVILLLGLFGWRLGEQNFPGLFPKLVTFNIAALLLAVPGGFNSLFALFISPQIRSWSRISIFIAFFSLIALGIAAESIAKRLSNQKLWYYLFLSSLVLVALPVGIWDIARPYFVPLYSETKIIYEQDQQYFQQVENQLPANARVFELPYASFPESTQLKPYVHFIPYLHTSKLIYSYGVMKGRPPDKWYRQTASLPVPKMIMILRHNKFNAVLLNLSGYADNGAEIIKSFKQELPQSKVIVSPRADYVVFGL